MSGVILALVRQASDLLLFAGGTLARHVARGGQAELLVESDRDAAEAGQALAELGLPTPGPLHQLDAGWSRLSPATVLLPEAPPGDAAGQDLLQLVLALSRQPGGVRPRRLLAFPTAEALAHPLHRFQPGVFVETSAEFERKREALRRWRPELVPVAEAYSLRWGAASGFAHAEAFTLLWETVLT